MKCQLEYHGDLTVLTPLDGLGARFHELIDDLLEQGKVKILVDLSAFRLADTDKVGDLVVAWKKATAAGGALKLLGLTPQAAEHLHIMHLDDGVFECFDTEVEARASFKK